MLNKTKIENAKPAAKPYKLHDERGLYLLVNPVSANNPRGSKGWRLRYTYNGREKLISLGLYPDVGLKAARDKRDEYRKLIAEQGIDPSAQRRSERHARASTFEAIAREWMDAEEKQRRKEAEQKGREPSDTIDLMRRRLERYIFPRIGPEPIASIKASDLLAPLKRIEAAGRLETARRVRANCGRIFRYAIATGRAERDVAADLKGALTGRKAQSFPAITEPKRFGELLRAIDGYQGQPTVMLALRLAPLVFVRPGELRAAEWSEFDFDAAEWRIAAERTKMGEQHIVPLSKQALAILEELREHTGDGRLLFPSVRSRDRPMSDNTLGAALDRLGFATRDPETKQRQPEHTAHGFRATASTLLNELGYDPDVIERQLAHAERNKIRAAYNRAPRLEDRRRLMQSWADHCDTLRDPQSNVTPLRREA